MLNCLRVALFVCLACAPVLCQSPDVIQQLERTYLNKDLKLKVPAMGGHLEYDFDGRRLKGDRGVFGLDDRVLVKEIELKARQLTIRGIRIVSLIDRENMKSAQGAAENVDIAIRQTDVDPPLNDVNRTLQKVFASNADTKARQCQPEDLNLIEDQARRRFAPRNIGDHARMACLPSGGRAYVIGKDATIPKAIFTPDPSYPPQFKAKRGEGIAVYVVRVDEQGEISDVVPLLGPNLADLFTASGVLRRWKFTPATFKGAAVPVFINVEIKFRLY